MKANNAYLESWKILTEATSEISKVYVDLSFNVLGNPKVANRIRKNFFNYSKSNFEITKRMFYRNFNGKYAPVIDPLNGDKRFNSEEWEKYPYYFDFVKQHYLLFSQFILSSVNEAELKEKSKLKLSFYTSQIINALSPSNFLLTNPAAIKLAQQTKGQSLVEGFKNLMSDIKKGHISQTDESAFEIGKNLACTKGAVVYENELIQLIQYSPLTESVCEYPMLMIPPWINKFYILDLHSERSMVEYALLQGQTIFIISWRNPSEKMNHFTFNDYANLGSLKAIEVIQKITKAKKINALGYCLGGTLLGITLAILKSKNNNIINSATFLAAMLDFSDIGPMKAIIDESLVKKIELEFKNNGMLMGRDLAKAFNALRPNDLVWYYIINNYLEGKKPLPFSVLYWTNDNTNLPGRMYTYYLRKMLLENKLSQKKALTICDVPIDLSTIDTPSYVIGTIEDHIAPCRTAFATTELLGGPVEFVLGDSGHIMGSINAPSKKNKYHHHINGQLGEGFEQWKKTAKLSDGSWWPHWMNWLKQKSGKQIQAREELGNKNFPEIEPAPGRYVMERIY